MEHHAMKSSIGTIAKFPLYTTTNLTPHALRLAGPKPHNQISLWFLRSSRTTLSHRFYAGPTTFGRALLARPSIVLALASFRKIGGVELCFVTAKP